MIDRLAQAWHGRGPLTRLLWPLSLLYGALGAGQRWLYRRRWLDVHKLPVPVIVVGNVLVGGAGKTPLVMALVQHLQSLGWRPGVISRGHGRTETACREVRAHLSAEQCGDEPLLIHQRTGAPVFVAARRDQAARDLLRAHPQVDVIVADDGLQHHRLGRDLNIAVFDERGTGNGYLLPAGPLREPWPRQAKVDEQDRLRHIDLVVHTGANPQISGFVCHRRLADHALAADGSRLALSDLRAQTALHALAGIAKPASFFSMLRQAGLNLQKTTAYSDHHNFTVADLPADPRVTVLVTEKDAVKLMPLVMSKSHCGATGPRLLSVPLLIEPEPAFFEALEPYLKNWRAGSHPLPSHHGHKTS